MGPRLAWRAVVMLAPPNGGSRVARGLWGRSVLFRALWGRTGYEMGHPGRWPSPPAPCAVIAGTRGVSISSPPSWGVAALGLLPRDEPHDGTVTVEETRLAGLADFATVDASHTWIASDPRVEAMVLGFLSTGRLGSAKMGPS